MEGLIAFLATVVVGLILVGIAYYIWKLREKRIETKPVVTYIVVDEHGGFHSGGFQSWKLPQYGRNILSR